MTSTNVDQTINDTEELLNYPGHFQLNKVLTRHTTQKPLVCPNFTKELRKKPGRLQYFT